MFKSTLAKSHDKLVFRRRVQVLVYQIGALLPPSADVLDIGTGDGQIAALIHARQTSGAMRGIDVMLRPQTAIPVSLFDGAQIPLPDASVDVVTFVDVLHHTDDPQKLICEAARVARQCVIIKDHFSENALDHATLRFMDWVGNAPHGVVLPYHYASRAQWDQWFAAAGLRVDVMRGDIPLYPPPASLIFGRGLHFVTRLVPLAQK
jgi:ubiquinone/menaquinone biosynthesis C-methylase UbiE